MRHSRNILALGGIAMLALACAPTWAATPAMDKAFKACVAEDTSVAERLKQCTAAIDSKQFKNQQLSAALTFRGLARGQQKNFAGALADLDEAIRRYPDMVRAYWFRGSIWSLTNDFDRALADLNRAVELAPDSPTLRRTRAGIYSQRKEHARAIDDLTTAIRLAERPFVEYALRGMTYEAMGERDKAIADHKKALEINPDYQLARKALALLDAEVSAEEVQLPPGRCSEVNVPHQERAAACAAVIEAGKLTPGQLSTAYCNLGYSLTELREYDRVVETSDKAITADATSACAYLNRGRAWYYKADIDRAIADYTQTIALDRSFHEAYASRGTAYHERRDFARAIADYDAAISIESDYAQYYSDRGNSRWQSGDNDHAIADLTRAIEIDPKYAKAYIRRGWVLIDTTEYTRAEADFAKALEFAPDDYSARAGLKRAQEYRQHPEYAAEDRESRKGISFERMRRLMQLPPTK